MEPAPTREIPAAMIPLLDELYAGKVFAESSQVARVLGISTRTLRRLSETARIGWQPKGASEKNPHRLYAREDVEAYLRGEQAQCPFISSKTKTGSRRAKTTTSTSGSHRRVQRNRSDTTDLQELRKRLELKA